MNDGIGSLDLEGAGGLASSQPGDRNLPSAMNKESDVHDKDQLSAKPASPDEN